MIEIKNLHYLNEATFEYDVRVDRWSKSPLGNPFTVMQYGRTNCIKKYEAWFKDKVAKKDAEVMQELRRLYAIHKKYGKLRLWCWCAPYKCHCEIIENFLNKYIKGGETK